MLYIIYSQPILTGSFLIEASMLLVFVLPLSLYGQTSLKSIKTSLKMYCYQSYFLFLQFRGFRAHSRSLSSLISDGFLPSSGLSGPPLLPTSGWFSIMCQLSLTSALFSPKIEVTAMTSRLLQALSCNAEKYRSVFCVDKNTPSWEM